MRDNPASRHAARRALLRRGAWLSLALAFGVPLRARAAHPDQAAFDAWVNAPGLSPSMRNVRGIIRGYFLSQHADATLAQKRQARIDLYRKNVPLPDDLSYQRVDVGAVHGEWSFTDTTKRSATVLLYLHGGGYVVGSAQGWRQVGAVLGREAGMRTFSSDYRLGPEHPYPAALDDAVAGYRWLLDQGVAANRIVIAGDSAGGGLALACLLRARQEGLPLPAAAFLIAPWTDLTLRGGTIDRPGGFDPFNRRPGLASSAKSYLAGHDPADPLVSPMQADLKGLPPLLIHVGDDEAYLDDALGLEHEAHKAGVTVRVRQWPHVFHVWHAWKPLLPEAAEAMADGATFLRQSVALSVNSPTQTS